VLDTILADTRTRVEALKRSGLISEPPSRTTRRSLFEALSGEGLSVIAEIKRRSPSRGRLAEIADPVAQALRYQGAQAVSVLTEPNHFSGSPEDLRRIASVVTVPVLRKDFILDPIQIWETAELGADALLLIVGALTHGELRDLLAETSRAGLEALVEVHNSAEITQALAVGAQMIGVNNRDLASFDVDLAVAEALAPQLVDVPVRVAESGIVDRAGAVRMERAGYQAVLVGEALVAATDPAALIAEIRGMR
jgi:indole-3-glycerol phosphate synthase